MQAKGNFIYKGLKYKDGGTFKNDKGQEISYKEKYVAKYDELTEQGEYAERSIGIPINEVDLISKLNKIEPYTNVALTFDVKLLATGCQLKLADVAVLRNSAPAEK